MSGWIFPTSVATGGPRCVFDKGEAGNAGWALVIAEINAGDLGFVNYTPTGRVSRSSVANVLAANRWTHVAGTWDGTMSAAGIRLYVDGAEVTYGFQVDGTGARPDDSAVTAEINCNASTGLSGVIDDVKVFDRILTPAEIAIVQGS